MGVGHSASLPGTRSIQGNKISSHVLRALQLTAVGLEGGFSLGGVQAREISFTRRLDPYGHA